MSQQSSSQLSAWRQSPMMMPLYTCEIDTEGGEMKVTYIPIIQGGQGGPGPQQGQSISEGGTPQNVGGGEGYLRGYYFP